jgi:hypothetical protein
MVPVELPVTSGTTGSANSLKGNRFSGIPVKPYLPGKGNRQFPVVDRGKKAAPRERRASLEITTTVLGIGNA